MTVAEALEKGIKRLRLPFWNHRAYLKLNNAVFATLYDPFSSLALSRDREHGVTILVANMHEDDWEEYTGLDVDAPLEDQPHIPENQDEV